jgi:hypothetical protein
VRLGTGLPPRRKIVMKDGEITGVSRAHLGFRAHAGDVVQEVGDRGKLLIEFSLKLRLPSFGPPLFRY